jgi:hypothetical protein
LKAGYQKWLKQAPARRQELIDLGCPAAAIDVRGMLEPDNRDGRKWARAWTEAHRHRCYTPELQRIYQQCLEALAAQPLDAVNQHRRRSKCAKVEQAVSADPKL